MQRTTWVYAHESAPACLALTSDGRRLATASVKGTVIRVFDTLKGTKLQEVRSGCCLQLADALGKQVSR